jgi:hypothetical protein
MSTEVVSSIRNFIFSKVIPAVSDFIKNELAPSFLRLFIGLLIKLSANAKQKSANQESG